MKVAWIISGANNNRIVLSFYLKGQGEEWLPEPQRRNYVQKAASRGFMTLVQEMQGVQFISQQRESWPDLLPPWRLLLVLSIGQTQLENRGLEHLEIQTLVPRTQGSQKRLWVYRVGVGEAENNLHRSHDKLWMPGSVARCHSLRERREGIVCLEEVGLTCEGEMMRFPSQTRHTFPRRLL